MKKVLFLSTDNSARSQMAEAIVNKRYHSVILAMSAGVKTQPINDNTLKVLKEIGIDISHHTINTPEDFKNENFDYVITLCDYARENCPVFWTKGEAKYRHYSIFDPALSSEKGKTPLEVYRDTRDELESILIEFFDRELRVNSGAYNRS